MLERSAVLFHLAGPILGAAILWIQYFDLVEPTELAELARGRAAAIVGALMAPGGLEASRVKTKDAAPVSRKKQGSDLVASQMTMTAAD